MLFLGFSFSDPNVNVLLRLARTQLDSGRPEHFTVMRRPRDPIERALHTHFVRDLEASGIGVYEIDDFDEMEALLAQLFRRTRPANLFLSGSDPGTNHFGAVCETLGVALADLDIALNSLAGPSGMQISYAFGSTLRDVGGYKPDAVKLFFRAKDEAPPHLPERIGTAIYTNQSRDNLRESVLSNCRASLIVGGGTNTLAEFHLARDIGVPTIPVAISGGAATQIWCQLASELPGLELGGRRVGRADFAALHHHDIRAAVAATVRLVRQAMHLDAA